MRTAVLGMVLILSGGAANADDLVWRFVSGDDYAFLGVVAAEEAEVDEAHYPFTMTCLLSDGDSTTVSDVDAKALGAAIASDRVPTFTYVLDGVPWNDGGGEVADIHFGQMEGVWEYLSYGASYDLLLGASKVSIEGVGVRLDLPVDGMKKALGEFKAACDAISERRAGN